MVFGVNDTQAPVKGRLRFGVFELAGAYRLDTTEAVEVAPNASTPLASFPAESWAEPDRSMCFAVLTDAAGNLVARNRYGEGFWKDMTWPAAAPRVRLANGEAVFESDVFALGVCIDLDGERELADNFFDLYPGIEHRIAWPETEQPRILHVGNLSGGEHA